jgi:hypothetical protein
VAGADGEILGFALSWVCGDFWFLAELFVAPGYQGNRIGGELLARTFEHARKAGATNKCLITFTFNVVSQGLYIRHGMLPRLPIYLVSTDRDTLKTRPQSSRLRSTPVDPSSLTDLKTLVQLDVSALGFSREKHHRYLLNDPAMRGLLFHHRNDCVGYAYISAAGQIGPLAVTDEREMDAAFSTALESAASTGSTQFSAFLPGVSTALSAAVDHGMRIAFPMVLVSERDFGDWTRYLPKNPGLM